MYLHCELLVLHFSKQAFIFPVKLRWNTLMCYFVFVKNSETRWYIRDANNYVTLLRYTAVNDGMIKKNSIYLCSLQWYQYYYFQSRWIICLKFKNRLKCFLNYFLNRLAFGNIPADKIKSLKLSPKALGNITFSFRQIIYETNVWE